jgi:hypothetical protein
MTRSPDEQQAIEDVVTRLIERFPGSDAQRVQAVVVEEHHRLEGRPIRDFVPVLVERAARQRLAGESTEAPRQPWEGDVPRALDDPAEIDPMERERQEQRHQGSHLFGDLGGGPA